MVDATHIRLIRARLRLITENLKLIRVKLESICSADADWSDKSVDKRLV